MYLLDGSTEFCYSRNDFRNLISEKLGRDAEERLVKIIDEADYTTRKLDTDLISYEMTLDSYTACFNVLLDNIEEIKKIVSSTKT